MRWEKTTYLHAECFSVYYFIVLQNSCSTCLSSINQAPTS